MTALVGQPNNKEEANNGKDVNFAYSVCFVFHGQIVIFAKVSGVYLTEIYLVDTMPSY